MAALSLKNFLAPLQNKMQLGTIIIVAVLVALFRISGGGISTGDGRGVARGRDYDYAADVNSESLDERPAVRERARPAAKVTDDPLADLLSDPAPAPAPQKPAAAANNNLSDVRKALGLE